jgi:predicted O-methyltransferase YrrM
MMHIGPNKAKYLSDAIQRVKNISIVQSLVFLELGSYCGYSSVLIASELARRDAAVIGSERNQQHSKLISIEPNASCVEWTRRMAELSGLSSYITVIQTQVDSPSFSTKLTDTLLANNMSSGCDGIDLVFIDHDKARYLDDLLILEGMRLPCAPPSPPPSGTSTAFTDIPLLKSGCVVVADNVLSFNSPLQDYLDHVRPNNNVSDVGKDQDGQVCSSSTSKYQESQLFVDTIEYAVGETSDEGMIDGVEVSILK